MVGIECKIQLYLMIEMGEGGTSSEQTSISMFKKKKQQEYIPYTLIINERGGVEVGVADVTRWHLFSFLSFLLAFLIFDLGIGKCNFLNYHHLPSNPVSVTDLPHAINQCLFKKSVPCQLVSLHFFSIGCLIHASSTTVIDFLHLKVKNSIIVSSTHKLASR